MTRLKLVVTGRASVATERPVILTNITLLTPSILQMVLVSRFQVSHPYGEMDKTGRFCVFNNKTGKIFILKIFLPPDWSLSDNVLIGSYGGYIR